MLAAHCPPLRQGIADNKMKMAAAGSLGIALVLALAGTISPTMWTMDLDASENSGGTVCGKYDATVGRKHHPRSPPGDPRVAPKTGFALRAAVAPA